MKSILPIFGVTLAIFLTGCGSGGKSSTASTSASSAAGESDPELSAIVDKIQAKISQGKEKEEDFSDELKELDNIYGRDKEKKPDTAVGVLVLRIALYSQVLENPEKAIEIARQVQKEFPNSPAAKNAADDIKDFEKQAAAQKIERSLATGAPFPDFAETDVEGKPLSVSGDKGKIVLIDFWATWCAPCVAEMPNVIKTYQKYHDSGLEIIGVSLDNDKEALTSFVKTNNMAWPEFFDGKGWSNKLVAQYGITAIPATYLIDRDGKIVAKKTATRRDDLDAALAKLIPGKGD